MSSKYNLRIWKDSVVVHFNVLERLNKIKKNLRHDSSYLNRLHPKHKSKALRCRNRIVIFVAPHSIKFAKL
jgi:hypothetical protein